MGSPNEAATEPGSGTATVNPTTSSLTTQNSGGGNSSSSESNNLSSVTGITYTKTVPSNANPSGITCSAPILSTTNPDLDTASVNADSQTPNLQSSDHYCLRWINHGSHVLSVFSQLLRDEALVDVTLAAEGQSLRAHKMVLSACSSFFRTIFVSHPERHPIIIFKDTKFDELKTLLEFMYKGEVSVEYGQLGTLLKTAENLRVKGLAEVTTNQTGNPIISPLPPEDLDDDASPIIVEQEQINSVEPSTEDESRTAHRSRDRRSHHTHPYYSRTRSHQHHQTNFHRFSHHESNSANSHGLQCLNHKPYPLDHRERNISTAEELSLRRSRHHHQRQSHIPEQYHHHSRSDVQLEKEERKSRHSQMPTKNLNRPSTAILLDNDRNHRKTSRQPSGEGRTSEIGSPTTGKPNLDSSTTAQDLRKIPPASRSPSPLPTSGPFRTGVISSGNNVQHLNWPAEYTESSESDCDDCSMQSPSEHAHMSNQVVAGQNASERPTHTFISGVTGSNRLDPPQRLPISLKKETEWEVGSSLSIVPGASRSDVQPSRSPSFSESSSEYGRHVDQFSDDQMPAAEVVIEEGDFLSPSLSGGFSSDRECGDKVGASRFGEKSRRRARNEHQVANSSDAGACSSPISYHPENNGSPNHPRMKRFLSFGRGEGDSYLEEVAEDLSTSPGGHGGKEFGDELAILPVNSSGARQGPNSSDAASLFTSLLPIMAPQFDFSTRFAGVPLNFGSGGRASRSGNSTPRPGPSSGLGAPDGDDDLEGSQRSSSAGELGSRSSSGILGNVSFNSGISLIESHVGVGFTLGSREKPYKCEQCGQCYKYLSAFTKHKEQNHTARLPGEKPFRCEVCGMQFKYLKSFKKHRLNHAVERLHPVYTRPCGGLSEERSVLEMIARPPNDNIPGGSGQDGDEGSPGYRDRSSPRVVHIKTEIEAASSGESDDGKGDSNLTSQEETTPQQSIVKTTEMSSPNSGSVNQVSSSGNSQSVRTSALQRQVVVCPNCRMKFVDEESLRIHSVGCLDRMVRQPPSGGSTSAAVISLGAPGPPSNTEFFGKDRKFGTGTVSPSFFHEALRQQQAAFLAANFFARKHIPTPPQTRNMAERDVPGGGANNTAEDPMEISDKDGSDGDGEDTATLSSQMKVVFPSAVPQQIRAQPPAIPPPPPPPPPYIQNVFREISAVATSAAMLPGAGVPPPLQEYDPGRPHLCPYCGKGFRAKENLKLHIRKHTGEKPFECEFCGRAFGGKSDMNRHLRIHTGERPYRCDACGKTFARADYLSKHLSTHLHSHTKQTTA